MAKGKIKSLFYAESIDITRNGVNLEFIPVPLLKGDGKFMGLNKVGLELPEFLTWLSKSTLITTEVVSGPSEEAAADEPITPTGLLVNLPPIALEFTLSRIVDLFNQSVAKSAWTDAVEQYGEVKELSETQLATATSAFTKAVNDYCDAAPRTRAAVINSVYWGKKITELDALFAPLAKKAKGDGVKADASNLTPDELVSYRALVTEKRAAIAAREECLKAEEAELAAGIDEDL